MQTVSICGQQIQTLSGTTKDAIIEKPSSARLRPLRTETPIVPTVVMQLIHLVSVSKSQKLDELPSSVA